MRPLEAGLLRATRWLVPGLVVGAVLLIVDVSDDVLTVVTTQLVFITVGIVVLAFRMSDDTDRAWFDRTGPLGWFTTAAAATALVTGWAALVTLATSAALQLDPSLQFLQLLSALDIAWVVTATVIGFRWVGGRLVGQMAGVLMGAVCVLSIWRYLGAVGFTASGGWLVSADDLWIYVLPFDITAAVIAMGSVIVGSQRQATAQPSPQS